MKTELDSRLVPEDKSKLYCRDCRFLGMEQVSTGEKEACFHIKNTFRSPVTAKIVARESPSMLRCLDSRCSDNGNWFEPKNKKGKIK
jgi:hypothetical protein